MSSWVITKMCLIHCDLELWWPKSSQFIFEMKWMFAPHLKKFLQGVHEVSPSQGWEDGRTPQKHHSSGQGYRPHRGLQTQKHVNTIPFSAHSFSAVLRWMILTKHPQAKTSHTWFPAELKQPVVISSAQGSTLNNSSWLFFLTDKTKLSPSFQLFHHIMTRIESIICQ